MILPNRSALRVLGASLLLAACASVTPPAEESPPPLEVEQRIQQLEAAIALDEEALKALISDPERTPGLREDPQLIEIGERLPRLQAELRTLRPPAQPSSADAATSETSDGD